MHKSINKIAYVGNFRPYWSTENHIAKSLENIGKEVIRIQEDELRNNKIPECDLVLYTKTWGIDLTGVPYPVAMWHLDIYKGLAREKEIRYWPNYDYVFTPDARNLGENHHYMKAGVLKDECVDGTAREEFKTDIVFLGSYSIYHREWPHRKALIDFLQKTYGERFRLYPKDVSHPIWGQTKNDLFASAKIVVGDSLYTPHYWSDRIYETMGRGGFLIHPKIEGLEEEFEYGVDFVPYQYWDFEGLKTKIDYYLSHNNEREEIRKHGQQTVRDHYTYDERAKQVLKIIESNENLKHS